MLTPRGLHPFYAPWQEIAPVIFTAAPLSNNSKPAQRALLNATTTSGRGEESAATSGSSSSIGAGVIVPIVLVVAIMCAASLFYCFSVQRARANADVLTAVRHHRHAIRHGRTETTAADGTDPAVHSVVRAPTNASQEADVDYTEASQTAINPLFDPSHYNVLAVNPVVEGTGDTLLVHLTDRKQAEARLCGCGNVGGTSSALNPNKRLTAARLPCHALPMTPPSCTTNSWPKLTGRLP